MPIMPNEKDDKANKNNGVDSRKNLKKKERHKSNLLNKYNNRPKWLQEMKF